MKIVVVKHVTINRKLELIIHNLVDIAKKSSIGYYYLVNHS